jgi:hypothetical protein
LPLAEQIPALVQHNLNATEPVTVGMSRGTVRLSLEEFMLLSRKLIDVVSDLLRPQAG